MEICLMALGRNGESFADGVECSSEAPDGRLDEPKAVRGIQRQITMNRTGIAGGSKPCGARPPTALMVSFIDDLREEYGGEPICAVPPIAASTYYRHKAREAAPRCALPEHSATSNSAKRSAACVRTASRYMACVGYGAS
jgi:hypothetical protein